MKNKILLFLLLIAGAAAEAAALREISYYCTRPVAEPPVIDGRLEDSCWQTIPEYTATYEYFKPTPGPGGLRNSIRMGYDRQGLYLAIINYDSHTDRLRQNIVSRDDGDLWTDDCAEIFLENQPSSPGYRKFTVNSRGVVADIMQMDGNVSLPQWNGMGCVIKNQIYSDRWTIEAFFPWEDLGRTPRPGDVWRFCHVRFSWSSGNFIGTSSSPGGNYKAIDNFGYLYFLQGQEEPDIKSLASLFHRNVAPPWGVTIGKTLVYNSGDGVCFSELSRMVAGEKERVAAMLRKLENPPAKFKKTYDKLKKDFAAIRENGSGPSFIQFRQYNQLAPELEKLAWNIRIALEFN